MKDKNTDKKTKEETSSALEDEGIVIETIDARSELEDKLNAPQTKEEEKELFDAIGAEMHKPHPEEAEPEMDEIKDNLNKEGIELLPVKEDEDEKLQ